MIPLSVFLSLSVCPKCPNLFGPTNWVHQLNLIYTCIEIEKICLHIIILMAAFQLLLCKTRLVATSGTVVLAPVFLVCWLSGSRPRVRCRPQAPTIERPPYTSVHKKTTQNPCF